MNLTAGQARNSTNLINPSSSVYFLSLTGEVLQNCSAWVSCIGLTPIDISPHIPRILSGASVVTLGFSAGNKNLTGKVVRIARALVAPNRQWGMSLAKSQKIASVLTEIVEAGKMAPVTRCRWKKRVRHNGSPKSRCYYVFNLERFTSNKRVQYEIQD